MKSAKTAKTSLFLLSFDEFDADFSMNDAP